MVATRGGSPARFIATSFLGAIAAGTAILSLPISHATGADVTVVDALFTATSAVCVTGLNVVDTGSDLSRFGQVIVLVLFQLGGLGLLTFGTFLTLASGGRVGFDQRRRVQEQVSAFDVGGVLALVRRIVVVVVLAELAGAVVLYPAMAREEGLVDGAFFALFHSVSAFNNAGFALYADSLSRFVGDWSVTLSGVVLIVTGGLGFIVLADLRALIRDTVRGPGGVGRARLRPGRRVLRGRGLSLHSRMALSITAVLIAFGVLAVLVFESGNPQTLGPLSFGERLQASLFQGVTPRTAGFNTLDYSAMTTPMLMVTMLLMFVGGNPGSTAGGVKTLTVFVLVVALLSVVRNRREFVVFDRRISPNTVVRAGVVVFGAGMLLGAALTVLTITDPGLPFVPLLFEAVSAFGTVGLSMGVTAELSTPGRLVVIVLMYLGRIGFLTFALALVTDRTTRRVRYPEEEVVIG